MAKVVLPNGKVQALERCSKPVQRTLRGGRGKPGQSSPDDGWQVWTQYNNENNMTFKSFLGNFNVPPEPENWDGGILYFFTGLQNDDWVPSYQWPPSPPPGFDIIQPVLQFGGDSVNGGGDYWGLASWYVTLDSNVLYSDLMQLNAGDSIFGNMTMFGSQSWYIGGTVNGQSTDITISYPRLVTQSWAYCTMEVYSIDNCDNFPSPGSKMTFNQLSMTDANGVVTPNWQEMNNQNHCSVSIAAQSPSQVTLLF